MEAYTPLQWLLIFFVYSVLGWVWESCYVSVKSKRWVNRGFLHGPWLPIYGSGAVVVLLVTLPARGRPALIFLLGMIGATVLEYVTGESMEKLFHMRYWDYSDKPLNVNGHICLGVSIGWGVFSLVLLYVLHPPVEDLVLWLPVPVAQVLALCLTAAFAVDTTWSVQKALDTKHLLASLSETSRRLAVVQEKLRDAAKELELDRRGGCILSYNGGKIIDCKTGETLVQHEFPPELIDPVCTFARYWNVMPLTYDAKGIVTEDAANPYVGEEARINKIPARQVENLPAEIQWPINKLLLVGDPVDMPHVEELMQQKFAGKLSIYRSAPFFIETMPLGVEKSASLALLLKNMGLGPENLMACGDGWNDLPMIRYAGMGVAMGNAVPEVKQAAKYVTADNEHDGVGLAVEKFILEDPQ